MSRVFIILDQQHRDHFSKEMVSRFDFSTAGKYGELIFILPPSTNPRDPKANELLCEALADYTDNDFLLPVGSPVLILLMGAYAALAGDHVTRLNILEWERDRLDRTSGCYIPTTVDLLT